jgi:hypothetical protein
VEQHSWAFVGIDTSKLRNAIAVAEEGCGILFQTRARIIRPSGSVNCCPGIGSRRTSPLQYQAWGKDVTGIVLGPLPFWG